jgi:apolipoprotein N-acyltransferase
MLLLAYFVAAVSALVTWAAFPPIDFGWLAFIGPVGLFWALRRVERGIEAVGLGFLWGFVFYGLLLSWIFILGAVAWFPLTLLMAVFVTVYAAGLWAIRLWPTWRWWLAAVGGWALIELVRTHFPFGGFPWGSVGYAAAGNPGLIGSVQWVGPAGWTVVVVAFTAGLALLIEDKANWRFAVDTAVVVLLLAIAGGLFPPTAGGQAVRVAIVQGSTPCPRVHCQNENMRIFEDHLALTRTIPAGSVDLVVWAENSTGPPYEPEGSDTVRNAIVEEAGRIGAYFLVSGTRLEGDNQFWNVNVLFSPDGVKVGEYVKRHPVPFGEFVPMRELLGFIPQLEQVPRDMVRGGDPQVFPLETGVIGSVISFEGAFTRDLRAVESAGGRLFVLATNESTYEEAPASDQFIGMTRVNAAAMGQDFVHAAISGKSALITADGTVLDTTELFEKTVLYGTVQYRAAGPTLYARIGDWVTFLALIGLIVAVAWPGSGGIDSMIHRED